MNSMPCSNNTCQNTVLLYCVARNICLGTKYYICSKIYCRVATNTSKLWCLTMKNSTSASAIPQYNHARPRAHLPSETHERCSPFSPHPCTLAIRHRRTIVASWPLLKTCARWSNPLMRRLGERQWCTNLKWNRAPSAVYEPGRTRSPSGSDQGCSNCLCACACPFVENDDVENSTWTQEWSTRQEVAIISDPENRIWIKVAYHLQWRPRSCKTAGCKWKGQENYKSKLNAR